MAFCLAAITRIDPLVARTLRLRMAAVFSKWGMSLPTPPPGQDGPESGSNSFRWWTGTQSIRTAATSPFEVALVETSELPAYQRIARKALHLRELGLSDRAIGVRLGVTDKDVKRSLAGSSEQVVPPDEVVRFDGTYLQLPNAKTYKRLQEALSAGLRHEGSSSVGFGDERIGHDVRHGRRR